MRGIGSSELKRKFQAALPDSQINDSKVSATSARYPVSNWWKFDWSCANRRQVERVYRRLVLWWGTERNWTIKSLHHFVQRLLVPSARQQVAKPQVLMRSQQNCSKQEVSKFPGEAWGLSPRPLNPWNGQYFFKTESVCNTYHIHRVKWRHRVYGHESRYDGHFVGITWHNVCIVWSKMANIYRVIQKLKLLFKLNQII